MCWLRSSTLALFSSRPTRSGAMNPKARVVSSAQGRSSTILSTSVVKARKNPLPLTRLFLTVFRRRLSLNRDDLSKFVRGNIVPPEEFLGRGWVTEAHKIVHVVTIPERFRELRKPGRRRDTISFDLDQAHFLIGAALPGSGVDIQRELSEQSMLLHQSVEPLLRWYSETAEDPAI